MTDRHDPGETAERPATYNQASGIPLPEQVDRYNELVDRELTSRSIAILQARGEWTEDRARALNPDNYPALTVTEHLETLALGESIARYYRHPAQVDHAVRAGASWAQIAAASGTTEGAAREAYRDWAQGQHRYASMGDAEYARAVELADDHPGGEAARESLAEIEDGTEPVPAEQVWAELDMEEGRGSPGHGRAEPEPEPEAGL